MCIGATVNGDTVEYVLQSTGSRPLGWMAMGFGTSMVGSPMVVMWYNEDGTVSLSQRKTTTHSLPAVDRNPPRIATVSNDLSLASDAQPKLAYSVPMDTNTRPKLIWAYGVDTPAPSDPSTATFNQHVAFGTFSFDLTKSGQNATVLGSPTLSLLGPNKAGSSRNSKSSAEMVILAHAIVCAIAFLVVMPSGALLARYYRTFSPTWFKGHWILQFGISAPIVVTGLILAIAISHVGGPTMSNTHTQVGILLFCLYGTQCLLGGVIHFVKPKNATGRPIQNYVHAVLGLTIIGLAFYQVRTGYTREWPNFTGRQTPAAINVLWYFWVIAIPLLYAGGLVLLKKQYAQERESRARAAKQTMPWEGMKGYSV